MYSRGFSTKNWFQSPPIQDSNLSLNLSLKRPRTEKQMALLGLLASVDKDLRGPCLGVEDEEDRECPPDPCLSRRPRRRVDEELEWLCGLRVWRRGRCCLPPPLKNFVRLCTSSDGSTSVNSRIHENDTFGLCAKKNRQESAQVTEKEISA